MRSSPTHKKFQKPRQVEEDRAQHLYLDIPDVILTSQHHPYIPRMHTRASNTLAKNITKSYQKCKKKGVYLRTCPTEEESLFSSSLRRCSCSCCLRLSSSAVAA